MGVDYSVSSGYGFIVPDSFIANVKEQHEDDDYWDGFGEWLDKSLYGTGLSYLVGGSYYSGEIEYAVVAEGTTDHRNLRYDGGALSYVDKTGATVTVGHEAELRKQAHILGIEDEVRLGWLKSFLIS